MTRKNLIMNPSFETNISFWGNGGATSARSQDATEFLVGNNSQKLTATTAADTCYATLADAGALEVNQQYCLSMSLKGSGALRLWVYDGVSDTSGGSDLTLTSAWTSYSYVFTPLATTGVLGGVRLYASNTVTCYIDAVMLEKGPTLRDYFDGTYANASWSGVAHNSYSIENSKALITNKLRPRAFAPGIAR